MVERLLTSVPTFMVKHIRSSLPLSLLRSLPPCLPLSLSPSLTHFMVGNSLPAYLIGGAQDQAHVSGKHSTACRAGA
eukprot:365420-Chlamydomonas_euryale.AAC.13